MVALDRPFRPVNPAEVSSKMFEVEDLVQALRTEPSYHESGRSAVTLARDGQITVVLEALRKGNELKKHRAPSSATVALVSGRATFKGGDGARERMTPGSLVVFGDDVDHSLSADEDCAYLITIGGRERSA